jgi:hypothetical protein
LAEDQKIHGQLITKLNGDCKILTYQTDTSVFVHVNHQKKILLNEFINNDEAVTVYKTNKKI